MLNANAALPEVSGRYRLDGILGEGGMGMVYRGLDTHTGQPIAIKLLKSDAANSPDDITFRLWRTRN